MMALAPLALSMGLAVAQDQAPSLAKAPTAFETRNTSEGAEGEASIQQEGDKASKVTFTAVTESREWKDSNGKLIRGRLLAFEAAGGKEPFLVKDGKIRLLVDGAKRFSLMPLERLGTEDRTYIGNLAAARKQEAVSQKAH